MDMDPLNSLLDLEDDFYKEGYQLGVADGVKAGHLEGEAFGLEKGYEKFIEMGHIHGRATIWAMRLSQSPNASSSSLDNGALQVSLSSGEQGWETSAAHTREQDSSSLHHATALSLPALPANPRLEKHVQVLLTLANPASLSTENTEETIAEFDERLRKARAKTRVIEKIIGEPGDLESFGVSNGNTGGPQDMGQEGDGSGSIEDISSLRVRH